MNAPVVIALAGLPRDKFATKAQSRNKAVYLALGIQRDGTKDVLGLWIQQTEGAKFWLAVMNELKNRGVQDILIAIIDGLKAFQKPLPRFLPTPRFRLASYT